jgi:hypothetical protein
MDHTRKLAAAVTTLIPAAQIAADILMTLGMNDKAAVIKRAISHAQQFLDDYQAEQPGQQS